MVFEALPFETPAPFATEGRGGEDFLCLLHVDFVEKTSFAGVCWWASERCEQRKA
jgi:hypothetical protein